MLQAGGKKNRHAQHVVLQVCNVYDGIQQVEVHNRQCTSEYTVKLNALLLFSQLP